MSLFYFSVVSFAFVIILIIIKIYNDWKIKKDKNLCNGKQCSNKIEKILKGVIDCESGENCDFNVVCNEDNNKCVIKLTNGNEVPIDCSTRYKTANGPDVCDNNAGQIFCDSNGLLRGCYKEYRNTKLTGKPLMTRKSDITFLNSDYNTIMKNADKSINNCIKIKQGRTTVFDKVFAEEQASLLCLSNADCAGYTISNSSAEGDKSISSYDTDSLCFFSKPLNNEPIKSKWRRVKPKVGISSYIKRIWKDEISSSLGSTLD